MPDSGNGKLRGALSRSRRVFRRHRIIASVAVVLVLFVVATAVLFIWPATDQARRADGVVALLGPDEGAREHEATFLVEKGYASVLLFSEGNAIYDGRSHAVHPCPDVRGVSVVCFVPDPPSTIGEIEWASNYAKRHGWRSLIIVSGHPQVTEARLLMERCYSGEILMVPPPNGLLDDLSQLPHQWVGLVDALITDEHC